MKEIFDWVPWFQELANKINEGGRQTLAEKARKMDWGKRDPALLKHGDENIDPFSFIYYLAALNTPPNWNTVYRKVAKVFGIRTKIDYELIEPTYYPKPPAVVALFHDSGDGNPDLLWDLLEQAISDSVRSDTFEAALEIKGVGVSKLSQTLFLIDPSKFLPFDDQGTLALGIGKYKNPPARITWDEYRREMERITKAFSGCNCHEINVFSYLWKIKWMPVNSHSCYQVSTNVYEDGKDHWEDFEKNNWVYTGGPESGEPWPAQDDAAPRCGYPLHAPVRGDIVLVRHGQEGRGIGIVYRNDYTNKLAGSSRLHVLWLNKTTAKLAGAFRLQGFSRVWESTRKAFRSTDVYSPTIELLERLSPPRPTERPQPMVKHPLNQILYGPPGTGKTWNAVKYAMAIVRDVDVDQIGDKDHDRFRNLQFRFKSAEAWSGQIAMVTFHQSFSYEDFVEGIRPTLAGDKKMGYELRLGIFRQIAQAASTEKEQRFVLIIDEINRGNIPKIFGELITLIEDSKRLGKTDEMRVTLPYSNQEFGVPGNLFIISTMNTADRSIMLLDTALRRRFDFVEMMPDPKHDLISDEVEGVDVRKILKAMNERISLLLDREHQIGHTYLFGVTDLKSLSDKFQNKIVPLLQEYFYDDWSKIREVLGGAGFVSEQKLDYTRRLRSLEFVDEGRSIYERLPNDDRKWIDPDEYKKIYSDGSGSESS